MLVFLANRKSHTGFRLVPVERRNDRWPALSVRYTLYFINVMFLAFLTVSYSFLNVFYICEFYDRRWNWAFRWLPGTTSPMLQSLNIRRPDCSTACQRYVTYGKPGYLSYPSKRACHVQSSMSGSPLQSLSRQAPLCLADMTATSCPTALDALCGQLMFRLVWCLEHSAVTPRELLQPLDLACRTLFRSSCAIQTSPTDCSDDR